MKAVFTRSSLLLALAMVGCVTPTPVWDKPASHVAEQETGALKVDLGAFRPKVTVSSFQAQALPVATITQARLTVRGHGIAAPLVMTVPVSNGVASAEIQNIPIGPNRLITAEGLDANGNLVPGALIRAIAPVQRGAGIVSLTWHSTPAGSVLERLLESDLAAGTTLASSVSANDLQALVLQLLSLQPPQVAGEWHPSLIKAEAIAARIRASNGAIPAAEQAFIAQPATLHLQIKGLAAGRTLKARVNDPASRILVDLGNGYYQLPSITPGTWTMVFESPEFGQESAEAIFGEGASRSVVVDYAGSELATVDFGPEATASGGIAWPTPAPSPWPTATPSPTPLGDAFYNLLIRFDQ
ncbi:hypothetical protein D3C86_881520 [compost metagenome]